MNDFLKIPVFAISLPKNSKRRDHIREQFKNRHEFKLNIFRGVKSKIGYLGFLKSMKNVIKLAIQSDYDFIVVCSDDHEFTENYTKEKFIDCVIDAGNAGAKILLGGVERYGEVIPLTDELLWIDHFSYSTFYVIYKPYFQELLKLNLKDSISYNGIISLSTSNKFLIYPFITMEGISKSKERGIREYSRESSNSYSQVSILRLEKILYLKEYERKV